MNSSDSVPVTDDRVNDDPDNYPRAAIRIVRGGRALISQAALSQLSGLPLGILRICYALRSETGHPSVAYRDRQYGTLYFDEEQLLRWYHTQR